MRVKQCPGCDYLVPEAWDECRRCGCALAAVAPVPAVPEPVVVGAPPAGPALPPAPPPPPPATTPPFAAAASSAIPAIAPPPRAPAPARPSPPFETQTAEPTASTTSDLVAGAPAFAEELLAPARGRKPFAVAPVAPVATDTSAPATRRWPVVAVVVAALAAGAWWFLVRDGAGEDTAPVPSSYEVVAPIGSGGGLPSLSDVARIEGEANRVRAAMLVAAAGAEQGSFATLTPGLLHGYDPSFMWIDGGAASTNASTVSLAPLGPDAAVLAIQAGQHGCALARVSFEGSQQVTITGDLPCAAASAPPEVFAADAAASSLGAPVAPGVAPAEGTPPVPAGGGLVPAIVDELPTGEPVVP